MKNLLTALLLIKIVLLANISSAQYYVSANGNDNNSGTQSSPIKSINKVNSLSGTFYFNKGDVFYGTLNPKSGNKYDAYGSGANPIISGGTVVTGWTSAGSGIYSAALSTSPVVVMINGTQYAAGRYPNTGWLNIDNTSGNNLTSSGLSGQSGLSGAKAVIRMNRFVMEKNDITGQSGNTITLNFPDYTPDPGYGFFITNKLSTLDKFGEWFYSSGKLYVYSGSAPPVNVVAGTLSEVVNLNASNISFNNIDFQCANADLVNIQTASNISFTGCGFMVSGTNGIAVANGGGAQNLNVKNCTFSYINSEGIVLYGNNDGVVISGNTFQNIAMIPGEGGVNDYNAISTETPNSTNADISYNRIDNVGYCGIWGISPNSTIKNNYITNTCLLMDDGGGIYVQQPTGSGKRITGNIIINDGKNSAGQGTDDPNSNQAYGIYSDGSNSYTEIDNNTISGFGDGGIYMDDSKDINIHDNTCFNNSRGISTESLGRWPISNLTVKNNIISDCNRLLNTLSVPSGSAINYNFYGNGSFYSGGTVSLSQWSSNSGFDKNSTQKPGSARFEYNPTSSTKTITLGANYLDLKNVSYNGSITLAPYSSAVLIYQSGTVANQPPIADAGSAQLIILPISLAVLNGTASSDPDGSISSYQWTKISGPAATILTPTLATATATSLLQGVYQFELKVTDNLGAVGRDTVIVTVNAGTNQIPIANAGADKTLTLPSNTVTVIGSGTDADGTIASYQWSKISGPTQFTIATATQAQTAINNLVQGVYQFELKVTDNAGGIGRDTVKVTVNAALNQSPSANAGSDKSITLPTNSVTLTGSGTDPDGTIAIYQWTKISGPAQFTIATANQAQTLISGLVQGIYQFELKVTDNLGATGKDTISVTVNAAANQPPVANTGLDKIITLPINTVTLTGSGTDPDGTIASYQWSKVSGPTQFTIAAPTQAQTAINNLVQGVYQFELKVTDNLGAIGKDTVIVTVNAAPAINQPPAANAGTDISITLPTNTATLAGNGIDADGTIALYRWTMVAGPAQFTIASRSSAQTGISNLVQGVYQFELQVTDNLGATDTDTVIVTVNAASNQPPIANGGADKIITLPTNTVTATGSGTDPDGTIASYQWSKVSGSSSFTIAAPTQAQTAINNLVQGIYQFELKVTDNKGAVGRDTILVTVNAAPPPPTNQIPVANAGSDINITLPTNSATLTGSGTDPDGSVASYRWTKVAGPSQFRITSRSSVQTTITNLSQGVYQFELQVTDNLGATDTDTITVTVNPGSNKKPTGNAGSDKKVTLPTNTTTLSGSGTDPDGTVTSYQWSQVSGPASSSIAPATQTQTTISNLTVGVYLFEFKVTDDQGEIGADTVMVTVLAAPNQSPSANAGNNITITLPTNTALLNGSGTDPDGTIASYRWTQVGGPAQFGIASRNTAQTDVYNLIQGVYQFELTVTDNLGAISRDTVTVTVNAAANQPPVANAGFDNNITLPVNSVNLVGIGADADGTIVGYQWTKISGPSQFTIVSSTQPQTVVNNLVQGTYQFELTVTDNRGGIAKDVVIVIVNPAPPLPNQPPVANAGSDKAITLPTNSVILTGSGTDSDGSIASYQWTKISGPAQFAIATATQAQTTINNLVEGVYQFELTVTDNKGLTGKDIVTVTVNPVPNQAPVANAGADKSITLPVNSTIVIGKGTDADGTIASYQWTEVSGHPQVTIATPAQAETMIADLVEGIYRFELKVTDNKGAVGKDTMQITVTRGVSNISFAVYPNPASTTLNVKLDAISQPTPTGINIFDSRGVLMWKEEFVRSPQPMYKQINLTKYPNGIYFIEIGDDYSRQRLKFIKQ